MTTAEKTPGEYETFLAEAKPEDVKQAILHAETIRLEAAKASETTGDLQRELRERAAAALQGTQEEESETTPEGEAPPVDTELQRIVTYALLTEQAEQLQEAEEPGTASPADLIERIREQIGRATAEAPRIAT